MAWRSNLTCDTVDEAKQQLAAALKNVGLARKAKLIAKQRGQIITLQIGPIYLLLHILHNRFTGQSSHNSTDSGRSR